MIGVIGIVFIPYLKHKDIIKASAQISDFRIL